MARYIELDALVAEIERLEKKNNESENVYDFGTEHALKSIRSFINTHEVKEIGVDLGDPKGDKSAKYIIDTKTIEVKEVDLEKEIDKWYDNEASKEFENVLYEDIEKCAKHFFELGFKAQKGE